MGISSAVPRLLALRRRSAPRNASTTRHDGTGMAATYLLQVNFPSNGPLREQMATAYQRLAESINHETGMIWSRRAVGALTHTLPGAGLLADAGILRCPSAAIGSGSPTSAGLNGGPAATAIGPVTTQPAAGRGLFDRWTSASEGALQNVTVRPCANLAQGLGSPQRTG
ncbi:YdhR family protein [Streptomyces goshikiensis]|uniref:YdhR family protein n=1 Tax=Streptomyces goshikiensis TaxID=1942 RepID=UPI0036B7D092